MLNEAVRGFLYVPRAVFLLARNPRLWGTLLVPVLINLLVLGMLTWLVLPPALRWVDGLVGRSTTWETVAAYALRLVLFILVMVVLGVLVLQFGSVLGAPWYESLSVRIESLVTGSAPPEGASGPSTWLGDMGRALWFQGKKLLLLGTCGVLLLGFGLVPILGTVVGVVGGLGLGTLTVFLDILEPPLERAGRPGMRARIAIFRRTMPASLALSATCLALIGVPLLSLVSVPVCITAGTLFYCERVRGS